MTSPVSLSGGAPIWQGEGVELQAPEVILTFFFWECVLARVFFEHMRFFS